MTDLTNMNFAFLHGGGQGSWVWNETIAALHLQSANPMAHTLALDAPGCGAKRGRETERLTLRDVAQELINDIDAAAMRDVILVGHSQAGQAMAIMAELRPDIFQRFIYVSCSIPLPGQSVMQMMGKGVHGSNANEVGWPDGTTALKINERAEQLFCNDMTPDATKTFLAKLEKDMWPLQSYAFTDWRHEPLSAVPATYVTCLRDNVLPAVWQETFATRFKAERIVRIDCGHQAMNTRPHALAEVIRLEGMNADS